MAIVLAYHRLSSEGPDPFDLAVAPERFAEHLDVIASLSRPLDLTTAVSGLNEPGVAITFDDGYRDNLVEGLPLLEKHGMHATVFVTAGYVDAGRELWWDETDKLLSVPTPARVASPIGEPGFANLAQMGAPGTPQRRRWHARVANFLRPLETHARDARLAELLDQVGVQRHVREAYRVLSAAEIASVAATGVIAIGAHTVTHPVLALLPPVRQREEVRESKRILEEIVNGPVADFSYPYGARTLKRRAAYFFTRQKTLAPHYEARTRQIVQDAGFSSASTTNPGHVGRDRYAVRRFLIRNWTAAEFERRMAEWLRRH